MSDHFNKINYDLPLISVIIPNYNRVDVFQRAIKSVINQTYKNFEIIIIDDASSIDVFNQNKYYIESYIKAGVPKIIYLRNEINKGVSFSRNRGIKEANGEYIALLDSDDEWLKNKLELQVQFLQNSTYRVVHTEEIWIRKGIRVNQKNKHKKEGGDIFKRSLKLCLMSPSSIMIHKSVFEDYGLFDENLPVCEDYDLWLKITSKEEVGFITKPLIIKYGGHEDQLSRKYETMDKYRVISMINLMKSGNLNNNQIVWIKSEIREKANILYNGAVKRGKTSDIKLYEKWLKEDF